MKVFYFLLVLFLLGCENKDNKLQKIEYEEVNITQEKLLKTVEPITDLSQKYWDAQQGVDAYLQNRSKEK